MKKHSLIDKETNILKRLRKLQELIMCIYRMHWECLSIIDLFKIIIVAKSAIAEFSLLLSFL